MTKIKLLEVNEFEQAVLKSDLPVLVDFSAVWCGPCKAFEPVLEAIAKEQESKCTVVKVDIDESPELAKKYGVRSIPTVLAFKSGEVVGRSVGKTTKDNVLKLISNNEEK